MSEPVAYVEFVDGIKRPVYETPEGRQYVIDDDGEPVYGVWHMPREEWEEMWADQPTVVNAPAV